MGDAQGQLRGHVKIVELLPTRVVSFLVQNSRQPEEEVWELARRWATARGVFENPGRFHVFGFNNPVPLGRELRGYEIWITIPPGYDPGDDVTVKEFGGGKYAVMTLRGLQNIGPTCRTLYQWVAHSPKYALGWPEDYDCHNSPSLDLELCISPPGTPGDEIVMDYYVPIEDVK